MNELYVVKDLTTIFKSSDFEYVMALFRATSFGVIKPTSVYYRLTCVWISSPVTMFPTALKAGEATL